MTTVFLIVTNDEYELPVATGENMQDIADAVGLSRITIWKAFQHGHKINKRRWKCIKVDID